MKESCILMGHPGIQSGVLLLVVLRRFHTFPLPTGITGGKLMPVNKLADQS
jgi:hypothetical protein